MFPLFTPLLLGAGLGALTHKNPLKGGLLGASMGASLGALAPGILGGSAAAGAALPAGMAGPVAPQMGAAIPGLEQFATGYTPEGLLGAASQYTKPASQVAQLVHQSGLLDPQQPIAAAPPMQSSNTGTQILGQLAQAGDSSQQITQDSAARKKRRSQLLGAS